MKTRKDFKSDAEFDAYVAEQALLNPSSTPTPTPDATASTKKALKRYVSPKASTHTGVVALVTDLRASKDDPTRVACSVFIDTADGKQLRFTVSDKQLELNKQTFIKGKEVVINAEERIDGKTGYFDESDVERCHKATGFGLMSCSFTAEQAKSDAKVEDTLDIKARNLEIERQSASRKLADTIKQLQSADPELRGFIAQIVKV